MSSTRVTSLSWRVGSAEEGNGGRQAVLLEESEWERASSSLVAGRKNAVALTRPRSARQRSRPASGHNATPVPKSRTLAVHNGSGLQSPSALLSRLNQTRSLLDLVDACHGNSVLLGNG